MSIFYIILISDIKNVFDFNLFLVLTIYSFYIQRINIIFIAKYQKILLKINTMFTLEVKSYFVKINCKI